MLISYLIISTDGIWPFIIIGTIIIGVVFYVVDTMVKSFGIAKPHKKHRYSKIRKTPVDHKFKEIYEYIEKEYANNLEKNRKKLIKSIIICLILFIIAFVLLLYLKIVFDTNPNTKETILGLLFIPLVIYYLYKYKKYNNEYVENYKDKIIKNFVEHINHNLNYNKIGRKGIIKLYQEANFKDKQFNSFSIDDYINGYNEDGTSIELCNIALENVNEKGEFLNLIYEGIFSITQLNNYISEEIRIKKNQYIIKNNCNKIEMDSKEFEKYFDVYSNSDIITMEILTHDIMEELVQFYDKYKIKFEIVIKNYNIYIRFDTGAVFEPNILRKSNNINTLWVYYNILNFVTSFTIKINKLIKNIEV